MRKIRKRVFAAMLAAVLLFTMPGMASYAEAEAAQTEDISESVTVQAEDDAAEETAAETEAIQEPEAEDSDTDKSETGEDVTVDRETDSQEPAEEIVPAQKEDAKECTCGTLCTQDSINGDCHVCGAEDADLSRCKGEKTENSSEENKEDAEQEDTGAQDDSANLCAHHKEHTKDCGYSRVSEDGEGSPCTYDCRICPIEDLIAALPDAESVTENNADEVRTQLDAILDLYRELSEDEQDQIDLSPCWDLQAALDEVNEPATVDEPTEGDVARVEMPDGTTTYVSALAGAFVAENSGAKITLLADVDIGETTLNVPRDTNFTLDCGNFTLSGSDTCLVVKSGGALTFVGGTVRNTGWSGYTVNVLGTFTMSGGVLDSTSSYALLVNSNNNVHVTVTGGTVGVNGDGLHVNDNSKATIALSGGTYSNINLGREGTFGNYTYRPVSSVLAPGYALKGADGFIRGDATGMQRTVTVAECTHDGAATPNEDGTTHGGDCPYCGTEFEAAPHTLGADNKCEGCGTPLVASVKIDSDITYYGGIDDAWNAATAEGVTSAVVTLLDHVTVSMPLFVNGGDDITFDGGKFTLTGPSNNNRIIYISGGKLTVTGGTLKTGENTSGPQSFDIIVNGGELVVTGGSLETGTGFVGLSVMGNAPVVKLSGGTFHGIGMSTNDTVGRLLLNYGSTDAAEKHYAYYQGNEPVDLTKLDRQYVLTSTVTVGECEHKGVTPTPNNDGTHTLKCPYCGYAGTPEGCSYGDYKYNDTEHWKTCTVCQGTTTPEAHYLRVTAGEPVNGVTQNREACDDCDFAKDPFTVTVTVPSGLTYGNTGGKKLSYTVSTEKTFDIVQLVLEDGDGHMEWMTGDTLPDNLSAGSYKLYLSGGVSGNPMPVFLGRAYFTVNSAPLTGDMVTLSPESVTYSGAAQEPAVTVKQGDTTLADGTDYDVTYSTTDFTNAGTITVTITGKGNYTGEVKTAYTIERATPDIGTVTAEEMNDTLDVSQVVLSRTNQTPAGTLTLAGSTLQYGTHTYTWKFTPDDAVNYKPVTGTVQITVNDTIAPTAEYQIGTDGWKKFINTVSFGLFCKDYRTVTIRGTDDTDTVTGSGIALTQYYISDKEMTDTGNIAWNTYTGPVSLNAQGTYFIYVKVTDNAGNTAVLNSEGIVIYAESTVSPAAFDYTYRQNQDCTVQLTMNGNTFKELTDNEGNAISTDHYTIDSNGTITLKAAYLDTLGKGGYTYKVSMNPQGIETDQVTLVYTFTVNVKAKELTVTGAAATGRAYNGTNTVEITAVTISGAVPGDDVAVDLSGVQGTLSSANAGTYSSVTLPELTLTGADKGNYTLVQPTGAVAASVTVTPLDAAITVGTDTYNKTFGDAAFTLDVTDNNTEADVQYEVTAGADVISVSNGTVTIQNAGTAAITVSLPASTNYNAAASKTITVTVAKKGGYTVAEMNRSYLYSRGNTDSIDLAALLPKDCGNVTYGTPAASGDVTYSVVPAVNDGKLSYTLNSGEINAEGTITVTVETRNYTDITITVKVKLTDQIPVSLKTGTEVTLENNILTYGEPLSKLKFNEAEFVGDDGKTVKGILAWRDASEIPDAGTASATWVFIPTDKAYASVEGTAAITVNKAVPAVSAAPTVAGRVYDPSAALQDSDLEGGTVNVPGTWSWQKAGIIPTVDNSGYEAVFTPENTTNYETVTRTITVNVTKATPYIAELPAAAAVTYGETLKDSLLSGGTAVYGDGKGQAGSTETVAGAFTWKEPSTKPVAADSNVTEFAVVFTPSDTADYNSVEAKVKLTVNKAQNAPNMPGSAMSVSNSIEKVGSVPLPAGWEWQASDKDTALEVGVAVSAVAVYTGADKGNYENETVTVAITRSSCDHVAGDILYTGEGEKAPTCTEDGLGHRECTVCGAVMESGIVVEALKHTGGTATCSQQAVCTRCGELYGDLDSNVHGGTEVRGFVAATCTAGGYTGDTYCKDCGAKTGTGNVTPALGHDYKGRVTREPTTEREGERTYTCTRCGDSYKESIPKLPEETHEHSYTDRVTKEPTCTDTGVRIYTCACGDSYTETIAALGHHYLGSETKKPTTTAEGVMTYTCDRCGHSYTRPIAKLPGDDTTKPGSSQPGDTEPGSGNTEETRPEPGIPFIKGEDGKIGWEVIRAEEKQAKEGSVINVDMNGTTVVPGDIFDCIRGRDITITFDMGGGIIWSVDGKSVTADKTGDIDFDLKTGVNAIPVDIVNNITGENYSIQISLAHEGEFGFTAVLSINLGKENAGNTASLFYYNQGTGELEFICADEVAEDGMVSLAFTHASDYVIVIDGDEEESGITEPAQPEGTEGTDGDSTAAEESPKTGQAWRPWWFIVVGTLVIIMGIVVFFVVKKRNNERGGDSR